MNNELKVKIASYRIAFLMEHQHVIPDLKEIISELLVSVDKSNNDCLYLEGAYDALNNLIIALEEKGPATHE